MKTERSTVNLKSLTEQEIKDGTRRITNLIYDSAEVNRPPQLIREFQLAEMFGVTTKTTISWRNSGKLAFIRISGSIYYSLDDVRAFIAKHRVKASV